MREEPNPTTFERLRILDGICRESFSLLHGCTPNIMNKRASEICALFLSASETGSAISILGKTGLLVNDCYVLSRALFEKILNAEYLLFCSEDEFKAYFEYPTQKSMRIGNRFNSFLKEFSNLEPEVKNNLPEYSELEEALRIFSKEHPKLASALNRYTSKAGKEITHWTKLSVEERIEVIERASHKKAVALRIAKVNIYDEASEALHGTLYGCLFHLGAYRLERKQNNDDGYSEHLRERMILLLQCCFTLASDLLEKIEPFCSKKEIGEANKRLIEEYGEWGKSLAIKTD